MSKRELAIALLLFMGLLAPLIPFSECALTPQDQTISIVDTHDDKYVTELGRGIDSYLVHVLDPSYDLRSFVIFRGVEINFWEPLHNATLRLYTGNTLDFDKDSTITIYGMKTDELQNILPIGPSSILSMPLTDHYVNLNTSQFYGQKWWNIDVSDIVEELIRAHNWDGDGITGGEIGDAIGFIMLGAKGYDVRYFVDYRSDPALSAQLRIRWNHQPPLIDPPDDYEFVEQYRNYSIWRETIIEYPPPEYIFWREGVAVPVIRYDKVHPQPSEYVNIEDIQDIEGLYSGGQRQITRMENGAIYVVYYSKKGTAIKKIHAIHSDDEGATWIGDTKLSTLLGMATNSQDYPRIAVDSNNTLHVIWQGINNTNRNIWYANYTDIWSKPIGIISVGNMSANIYPHIQSAITIDEWDNLHVTWCGINATYHYPNYQIWYSNRTNGWSNPLRVSTLAGMDVNGAQKWPTITCDQNNITHIAWEGPSAIYPEADNQIWHSHTWPNTTWSAPVRVSIALGMNTELQNRPSIAMEYINNTAHIVWYGIGTGSSNQQIWYSTYTNNWTIPVIISTYSGMTGQHQSEPTIATYPDNSSHVLWKGKATGYTSYNCIWDRHYNSSWNPVILLQDEAEHDLTSPNLVYKRFPEEFDITYTYFITDLNGTILVTDLDDLDDAHDWIDEEQGYDPLDPEPPTWEDAPVAFSRFRIRLYLLILGYGCVWGPIWLFCWRRPSGYYICGGALVMLMGLGLLIQIVYV